MSKEEQIKDQLESKLFSRFSKNATLKRALTPTYNNRGEVLEQTYQEVNIRLVNYNITSQSDAVERWGEWVTGNQEAVIPYDVELTTNDLIVFGGSEYYIRAIRQPELPGVLVNIVRLEKVIE